MSSVQDHIDGSLGGWGWGREGERATAASVGTGPWRRKDDVAGVGLLSVTEVVGFRSRGVETLQKQKKSS